VLRGFAHWGLQLSLGFRLSLDLGFLPWWDIVVLPIIVLVLFSRIFQERSWFLFEDTVIKEGLFINLIWARDLLIIAMELICLSNSLFSDFGSLLNFNFSFGFR
jgi:hypothetical protein